MFPISPCSTSCATVSCPRRLPSWRCTPGKTPRGAIGRQISTPTGAWALGLNKNSKNELTVLELTIAQTTSDSRVTEYVPGAVSDAELERPASRRALVAFPDAVSSVDLAADFAEHIYVPVRIGETDVEFVLAGAALATRPGNNRVGA